MYSIASNYQLILEYPKYWTLHQYIEEHADIPRLLRYKFCQDVAKAMDYLQHSQIVHRDLSTLAVFVFSTDPNDYVNCKLGNICSCERTTGNDVTEPIYANQGENFRMPPEITSLDSSYTPQCDVYSYGVLMFHILTGLINSNPIGESGCVLPQYTRQIPSALVNIINNCCAINDQERPSFGEVAERLRIIIEKARKDEKDQKTSEQTSTKKRVTVQLL